MRYLFLLLFAMTPRLQALPLIQAEGELPAGARDKHGDTIGGIGSGMIYDAKSDVYLAISDRGPGDGTMPYRPRYVVMKITQEGEKLEPKVLDSVVLRDESGREMTGLIPDDAKASTPRMQDGRTCIDPEAIALAPDDTLYITDEYGPYLYQFQRDGKMIRRLELPDDFQPKTKEGKLDFTDKAQLVSGRNINQGPEGMCLLPDGKTAALAFQSGLMQDGGRNSGIAKILLLDLTTGKPKAMYNFLASPEQAGVPAENLSVNDLAAIDETRFLLLERDNRGRDGAAKPGTPLFKSVWLVDISKATNLLEKHTSIMPVEKKFVFNLVDLIKDPTKLSAKWETITIVPPYNKQQLTLLMAADNDFLTTVIYEEGTEYPFPRTKDAVPMQFYKIQVKLPEKP